MAERPVPSVPVRLERVLHLEDSDADAFLLRRAVQRAALPWVLQHVRDLASARAELARSRPGLLILDVNLDAECGLDLLPDARTPEGPVVVILSGTRLPERGGARTEEGGAAFLEKPKDVDGYDRVVQALARTLAEVHARTGAHLA